ncbi:MAG: tripartite tricarboxylate transporter substrate binding protein [Planctomycetota bacterium]|jgi:tripartite-type tricarboxylate transporter receptor subunit TctC|nr:tripartite tricarboxylate transporter substrate binding protein [Planctomycetota bacterium]
MMKKIAVFLAVLAGISVQLSAKSGGEAAENLANYPNKPVQLVVPYGPGGGTDNFARIVMKYVNQKLDRPVVTINVEGAGGLIGAMQVYNAPGDGYTLLAHNPPDVATFTILGQTDVNLWSELETICAAVADYNVISTNKATGWKTVEDMIAYAKEHPGEVKIGSTVPNQGNTRRLINAMGLKGVIIPVPYDGGAALRTALMGNHIQMDFNACSDTRMVIESGDYVPLLVLNGARIKSLPDVPTSIERKINITTIVPRGFYAPKGTDPAIVKFWRDAIRAAVEDPACAADIEKLGVEPKYVNGPEMKQRIADLVRELTPYFEELDK